MIYQADWLLTLDGPPIRDGWVHVEGDRVAATGSAPDLPADIPEGGLRRFDGCAILPGLVNAHCHLELTALEKRIASGPFPDWVSALQGAASGFTREDYRASAEEGMRRLMQGGTTTVLDVGNTGEGAAALARSPLRAFACVETLGLDPAQAARRFEAAAARGGAFAATERFHPGLAPHAAYSNSPELLRRVIAHQTARGLPVTIHAAESREEAELFASASGPLQAFCERIRSGAPEHRGTTPIRWLEGEGLLPDGALIVHGNILEDADLDILARRNATIVHCPSSHAFFGHPRFPYERLRARGIPVCLGTDSLASGDSLSMLQQMRLFSENYPDVPAEDVARMATTVAARALGMGSEIGLLRPGFRADFIAVRAPGAPDSGDPRDIATRGNGPVILSVLDGLAHADA